MTKRKKKTKGEKGTKEETKQNPVCLSKKKKKKAKLKTQVMLEQQHRGALVQIYSLQFCPQFFQGENTQAARPYSTKHPPKMFPLPFYILFFILSKIHSTKHNLCLQGPTTHHSHRKCYHISNREEKKVQEKKKTTKGPERRDTR